MTSLVRGAIASGTMITLAVLAWIYPASERVSWLVVGLVIIAITVGLVGLVAGYSALPRQRVDEIHQQSVWHLTTSPAHHSDYLELDVARCRWRSAVWRRDRPWLRPRRGAFFFADKPAGLDRWRNISRSRATYIYELDGRDLPDQLLGRDNEIAVLGSVRARVISHRATDQRR